MELAVLLFVLCAAEVSGQDDKITCSMSPVKPFQDAVLTCKFPEDPSVTRRDFTVNHYVRHGDPDPVIDCWWLRGSMDCYVRPGFEYNRTVNRQLSTTIRSVTSTHLGSYACQLANYGPTSLEFCQLAFITDTKDTCNLQKLSEGSVTLTCNFSQDIAKSQANFTVYRHSDNRNQRVVECWWEVLGRRECRTDDGYRLHDDVYSVKLPNGTKDDTASYSCWHTGSIADRQERCSSPPHSVLSDKDRAFTLALGLGFSVGFVAVVSLVVLVLMLRRRRKGRGRRKEDTSAKDEDCQRLVKTKKTPEEITKSFVEVLAGELKARYPNTYNGFYFLPPLYFNKTRCKKHSVGGDFVFVPDPSDPCDVRHDRAMQHVMHCLRHLAEQGHEPMFVLTQFQYKDYLNNPGPEYKRHCLPMPAGLKGEDKHVGCLDFLIVHREHGLLVGVVTAVSEQDVEGEDDEHKKYEAVVAQVTEAVKQLRKAERMIKQLLSDQADVRTVRHTLVLPNLTTSSLRSAVASHSTLLQDLQECRGSDPLRDPSELCLCADDLSKATTPWDVSSDVVSNIRQKWKWSDKKGSGMSDPFYLRILVRFFGPATRSTLQVPDEYEQFILPKTLSEAVSLTGDLYGRYTIDPDLLQLLDEPQVLLFGSQHSDKEIVEKKRAKQLCVLLDATHIESESVKVFCEILFNKVPDVYLWVSCLQTDVCPRIPRGKMVTEVLNCPPTVLREVPTENPSKAEHQVDDVVYLSLTDGPPVIHFHHQLKRRFLGFSKSCECMECGQKVGNFLTNTLLISTTEPTTNSTVRKTAEYPLKCKDILILFEIKEDITEDYKFLQGLRTSEIKVQAVKVKKDNVVAADNEDSAWAMNVRDMETYRTRRKVVVYVEADFNCRDLKNKRRALMSCTSQLILVRWPK